VRTLNHSYFWKSIWFPWNFKCRHSITSHTSLITFGCLTSAAIILFKYKFLMWNQEVSAYYIIKTLCVVADIWTYASLSAV
jgi:hypothetical protein